MKQKKIGLIEDETPIVPYVAAQCVVEEASRLVGAPLPDEAELLEALTTRAQACYEANDGFRKAIRSRGNAGRDWLWAFFRHWLAAELQRRDPALFGKLPHAYARGVL